MRVLKFLLIVCAMFIAAPARAGDESRSVNAEPSKDQSRSGRAARPQRKAVKLSPAIHVSPTPADESGNMRRIAPAPSESPLQNVPALKDLVPPGDAGPGGR
jgi:hypothetical protein